MSLALGLAAGLAVLIVAQGPLRDIDLYWHLLLGAKLERSPLPNHSDLVQWSLIPPEWSWNSTQWLAEVALFRLHKIAGWPAMSLFRTVTTGLAIAILATTTLRRRPLLLAGLPFAVTVGALAATGQERPQQFTYIGAAVLSGVLVSGLSDGRVPRWWLVLPSTVLWANLHGGWILVPGTLGLIALCRALDHGWRRGHSAAFVSLTLLSALAGLLTPAGFGNLSAALRVSTAAAGTISEWQRTAPFSVGGWATIAMLLLLMIAWSRGRPSQPSSFFALAVLLLLSWTAYRNMVPALLLMTPLVAEQLALAFPGVGGASEARWSRPAGITVASLLATAAVLSSLASSPLPVREYPIELAERIATLPSGQRVLNDYNVSGITLYFGGPGTRVGIDGRTDYYRAEYIADYLSMGHLAGSWEDLLAQLDPSVALVREETAIAHVLREERGWLSRGTENGYVLLIPGQGQAVYP